MLKDVRNQFSARDREQFDMVIETKEAMVWNNFWNGTIGKDAAGNTFVIGDMQTALNEWRDKGKRLPKNKKAMVCRALAPRFIAMSDTFDISTLSAGIKGKLGMDGSSRQSEKLLCNYGWACLQSRRPSASESNKLFQAVADCYLFMKYFKGEPIEQLATPGNKMTGAMSTYITAAVNIRLGLAGDKSELRRDVIKEVEKENTVRKGGPHLEINMFDLRQGIFFPGLVDEYGNGVTFPEWDKMAGVTKMYEALFSARSVGPVTRRVLVTLKANGNHVISSA